MSNTNYQQCTKALFLAVAVSMVASFVSFIALKNLEFTWLKIAGFANAAALDWASGRVLLTRRMFLQFRSFGLLLFFRYCLM